MDLFELTRLLVDIDSTTGKEQGIVDVLHDVLSSTGFTVQRQPVAGGRCNLWARIGDPQAVLSTHMDTVSPHIPFSEDGEFCYGRGVCDAKGILSAQILAAERLMHSDMDGIGLLFVVGEEGGSDGARQANRIPNRCRFLINGEPTDNCLASASKGALRVKCTVLGKRGHSSHPESGESAILKMIDIVQDIRHASFPKDPLLGETTFNVGVFSGGSEANVIPGEAVIHVMFRTVCSVPILKQQLAVLVRNRASLEFLFESDPVMLDVVEGFQTTVVSFATDIPLLTRWGIPFLYGPGSILDAHTPTERISKKQLAESVDGYVRLVTTLLERNRPQ